MKTSSLIPRLLSLITVSLLMLSGCKPANGEEIANGSHPQTASSQPTTALQSRTPTPTPTVPALSPLIEDPGPGQGEYSIEIHMPLEMSASEVIAEPGKGSTCIVNLPVSISQDGERKMARGSTNIECHYTIPHDPMPYTVQVINRFDALFEGEVFPPSESYPNGWIDGYLNIDGTHTQYYIDFQQNVPNLCPESKPCIVPGTQTFSLPFHLVDGDRIEAGWTFILHID